VAAFERQAQAKGLYACTLNADAFASATKAAVIDKALADWGAGSIDMVIYSLASPRRTDPQTGEVYKSVLKPIGQTFTSLHLDTDKKKLSSVTLEPASPEEIEATTKVMGGEDWVLWLKALEAAGLLAPGARTVAYSYIGPQVTWPIYKAGTIGKAKEHLEQSALNLSRDLSHLDLKAYVSVNKAVVTQASSAIPVVPLYLALLFKTMKARGTHEGCIEQMYRLLATHLCAAKGPELDDEGRIRLDDWEMDPLVQQTVAEKWQQLRDDNLHELTDFAGYQEEFLKLFGFGLSGIDYQNPTAVALPWPSLEHSTA
jgi:enoyl-[acyl-carrier protein] reductase/trans-2-enoyl-CoA reductase (NAD+)